MTFLTVSTVIISIYLMFESLSAIAGMPGGLIYFCHKIKYVFAFSSAIAFVYYAINYLLISNIAGLWLVFGSAGTLALFVWPRTVSRDRKSVV